MDEKYDSFIKGLLDGRGFYLEKILKLQQSIPGVFFSVNGEIKKDLTYSKILSSLDEPGDTEIQVNFNEAKNNPDFSNKEKILTYFEGYSNIVEEYFKYSFFSFRQIIVSIMELIPSELDDEGKEMAQQCKRISECLSDFLSFSEEMIITALKDDSTGDALGDLTKFKILGIKKQCLAYSLVDLNYLIIQIFLFRQHVHDYYWGGKDKKEENKTYIKEWSPPELALLRKIEKNQQLSIEQGKTIISNQVADKEENSREHANIQEEMNKKQRLERTKPLKLTTCLDAICEAYSDPKYPYSQEFKLHPFAIRNQLSNWNQYLNTDGKKGTPPLPKFDFYRQTDKETFKKWVRDVFFLDYRNRAHKDALDNASHPDNMDKVYVTAQQDIIDEVDESLANDHHHK